MWLFYELGTVSFQAAIWEKIGSFAPVALKMYVCKSLAAARITACSALGENTMTYSDLPFLTTGTAERTAAVNSIDKDNRILIIQSTPLLVIVEKNVKKKGTSLIR